MSATRLFSFQSTLSPSSKRVGVWFPLLLVVLLFGPIGCATEYTKKALITDNKLKFRSTAPYVVRGKPVSSICITAHSNKGFSENYKLLIPTKHWSNQCLHKSGNADEPCKNHVPISFVHSSNISSGCRLVGNSDEDISSDDYAISVDPVNGEYLLISDAKTGAKLMYVYPDTRKDGTSPWFPFLIPVAVLVDIATFPLQAVVFAVGYLIVANGP